MKDEIGRSGGIPKHESRSGNPRYESSSTDTFIAPLNLSLQLCLMTHPYQRGRGSTCFLHLAAQVVLNPPLIVNGGINTRIQLSNTWLDGGMLLIFLSMLLTTPFASYVRCHSCMWFGFCYLPTCI